MKAQRLFLGNYQEHEEHAKLGLKNAPKMETVYTDFYFKLEGVTSMYITTDGAISISYIGQNIFLKNEKKVFNKIKNYLE
jgi:hypothetical protein